MKSATYLELIKYLKARITSIEKMQYAWVAQSHYGTWNFFTVEPIIDEEHLIWDFRGPGLQSLMDFQKYTEDWKNTKFKISELLQKAKLIESLNKMTVSVVKEMPYDQLIRLQEILEQTLKVTDEN